MQKINNIFKAVAQEVMPSHSFLFERWSNAAEKIHHTSLPAVIHIIPQSVEMELNPMQTRARSTTTCLLAFFDKCPSLDASGEEMAVVIDRCKDNAKAFLAHLIHKTNLTIEGEIKMEVTEAMGRACLAGVVCEFEVQDNFSALCS